MKLFQRATRMLAQSFAFSGLLIGSACVLHAAVLPNDYTSAQTYLYDHLGSVDCFQAKPTSASCSTADSHASALVTDGHGGMASVAIGDSDGSGFALTAYSFGLFGPKDETVPIVVSGFATTIDGFATDSYGYASYITYEYSDSSIKWADNYIASQNGCAYIATFANGPCQGDGDFTLNSSVQSNSVFVVSFQAVAHGASSSAFIDPIITIDPSFADANLFTLVSSPGAFALTPEPNCGPVLAVLGALGAAYRWRRRSKMLNRAQ